MQVTDPGGISGKNKSRNNNMKLITLDEVYSIFVKNRKYVLNVKGQWEKVPFYKTIETLKREGYRII
jgi:hypothetical protein